MSLAKLNVTKKEKINGGSMKKLMVSLMLIISMFAFAAESAPSATVGYVKYDCVVPSTGYNAIALPVDAGYAVSNTLGDAIVNCNQVSWYDAANQGWVASGKNFFGWTNTFAVAYGQGLLVNVTAASSFIADGPVIADPVYNLVVPSTGYNMVMIPLTYGGTSWDMSNEIGDDITNCNQLSWYDAANQGWVASGKNFFGWTNTFATEIADPILVNVTAATTWPSVKSGNEEVVEGSVPSIPKGAVRNVYYHVQDAGGNEYDFSAAPYDNVTFKAWITTRPTELLQEFSAGSSRQMFGGAFSTVGAQIGNFPTPWAAGETVNFLVKDETGGLGNYIEGSGVSLVLDAAAADQLNGFEAVIPGTGNPILVNTPSSIDEMVPMETKLHQNYPNPFNPTTTIKFDLNSDSVVKLNVYNYNGQLVKSLVDGSMKAGFHTVNFDASNLSAGVYYYTMETANKSMTQKMVLVK